MDVAIGEIVNALRMLASMNDTLLIITAKHGESPIDPTRYVADGTNTPATLLGDAHSLLGIAAELDWHWRNRRRRVCALAEKGCEREPRLWKLLENNAAAIGMGEIYYGPSLALNYNVGGLEPGRGSADAGHYRDAERGRDLLRQHVDDRRSRRVRA